MTRAPSIWTARKLLLQVRFRLTSGLRRTLASEQSSKKLFTPSY